MHGMLKRSPDFHCHLVFLKKGANQRAKGVAGRAVRTYAQNGGPGAWGPLKKAGKVSRQSMLGTGLVNAHPEEVLFPQVKGEGQSHSPQ
jgi:hypothetical protein